MTGIASRHVVNRMKLISNKSTKKVFEVCVSVVVTILFMTIIWDSLFETKSTYRLSRLTFSSNEIEPKDVPCIDRLATNYSRVEDIFCLALPNLLPNVRNPCFYDRVIMGKKRLRCLPYFYVIGIDKSGTTDLFGRLTQHPLVLNNNGYFKKETWFWGWKRYGIFKHIKTDLNATLEMFLDKFANTAEMIEGHNNTQVITGDASPMDLWDFRGWTMIPQNEGLSEPDILTPHLLKYIHKGSPKFIIQLREPIERLYSDYIFLKYGKDPKTLHTHVTQAIDIMKSCLSNHSRRFCFFDFEMYRKLPVRIHLSCYSVFIREWLQVFPREAFHVVRTTEYANEMKATLAGMFNFLEIPPISEDEMKNILNQTRRHVTADKEGVVLPETKAILKSFYSVCNDETASLLNDKKFLWLDHYT